ncbi:alpha/beta hydrolase [Schinkia azotoformans]|nr:hypothetical protein [Schinkia azotoformans]MEC1694074.1 alpha/beta hydrolase [Schinkia azotoformans]MEC1715786.1 alpha/beta hydrolase [Schinkia azotoformans]MEC1758590.1 alpha/beta hydrolase [Schinkia azotoformans]MEC1781000.1 alpha/beta hydrolase [Schinkia azotoformans]MED4374416.1 alpha/beta hydrolase [Schinkia azotoformans]
MLNKGKEAGKTMNLDQHFFKINDQWNVIHLPERPNGFAILIIGDQNHYVDKTTSLWIQNPERFQMLENLREKGYTIFYSNLFGRHWGSPKSVHLLKQLYHLVIRREILNDKIHVIAEGMGALAALRLMNEMEPSLRSVSMLSPCLDLKAFINTEKNNKLFYKRLLKELAFSYKIEEKYVESEIINNFDLCNFTSKTPVKIWHSTNRVLYSFSDHSRSFEKIREQEGAPIELSIHLFEKRFHITSNIISYLKRYEQVL